MNAPPLPARRDGIKPALLLKRCGGGAHIFERGLRHDAALVKAPVVAELGQRTVDVGVIIGAGKTRPRIPARINLSETMHQRDGPGPWTLVDRGVGANLGKIERCRLQRQRNVDFCVALVDRNAGVDAGRKARADPSDPAPGLTAVADEIGLCAGPGPNSVGLAPGPETWRVHGFGRATAARIVA